MSCAIHSARDEQIDTISFVIHMSGLSGIVQPYHTSDTDITPPLRGGLASSWPNFIICPEDSVDDIMTHFYKKRTTHIPPPRLYINK